MTDIFLDASMNCVDSDCEGDEDVRVKFKALTTAKSMCSCSTVGSFEDLDPTQVDFHLSGSVTTWKCRVLNLSQVSEGKPMSSLATHLLCVSEVLNGCDVPKARRFFDAVESGYCNDVPYHNQAHAASVVHFMHALLFHGGVADAVHQFFDRDVVVIGCLVAAAIHDYDHLGVNNKFLEVTQHQRALKFSSSINENHHFEAAMQLLMCPENNFLAHLSDTKSKQVRELVRSLVLATDAAEDSKFREDFKRNCFESGNFTLKSEADALLALQIALKCADLGHLATDWDEHVEWVARLEQEFFCQGDQEREHGFEEISFLMDRDVGGVSESQTGFFEFVAVPLFQVLISAFPSAQPMLEVVNSNFVEWKRIEQRRKELLRRHTMA